MPMRAYFSRFSALSPSFFRRILLAFATVFMVSVAYAQTPPPAVNARSWVLIDATTAQVLASSNADERVEPASLTKLMTAYLTFEALQTKKISMSQVFVPSEAVRRVGKDESRMFLEANKPVTVQDLVYGMIIQSGNDAAIALAELVGGSEAHFVTMMNEQAKRLGMSGTHFVDVNGMPDPQHYTTAKDMALLSMHLIRDFPDYYNIFSVKEFTYNKIKQPNRNRLLWIDSTVDGLKTGHTKAAGYCLIATAKRPVTDVPGVQRRLVVVMMGEKKERDRVQDSLKMLNYGYNAFTVVSLNTHVPEQTVRVYKGESSTVRVGLKGGQYVTAPRGGTLNIKASIKLNEPLIAPLANGQQIGMAEILIDNKPLAPIPMVALQAVPQAGLLGRLWDSLILMFNSKKK